MSNELLFVYGTLRKGFASPLDEIMAHHCEYFTDAIMQGILYDVGGYPGATTSTNPTNKVLGELYSIRKSRQLWSKLDHYEHCSHAFQRPHEYVRKKRRVLSAQGENLQAWVYLFNWEVGSLLRINSGDYLEYLKTRCQVQ